MDVDSRLGDVVAERAYEATQARGGEPREVLLRIGRPRVAPHLDGAWTCPVQIHGMDEDDVLEAVGIDAVQALYLALSMAGARLTYSRNGSTITWLGGSELGLPLPAPAAAAFDFGEGEDPEL
jgi:hypothetical protein